MPRFTLALVSAVVALTLSVAPAARAGIADSPLPVLVAGQTTLHLYSVPGVINSAGLGTYFSCTSTDTTAVQVCVEVFGFAGGAPISNDCSMTSLSVPPGGTETFGTSAPVGISIQSNLGAGAISRGSARILATSKKLVCTAFLADVGNAPPTSMTYLTVIAKLKQKAAN
jgi:hypothetical protein